jgi:type II secretory pathway pseudopilin PulG
MRNQKGITLIALVITIIVLLILAGVTIAMLTGENGILTNANKSSSSNAYYGADEQMKLAYMSVRAEIMAQTVADSRYSPVDHIEDLADVVRKDLNIPASTATKVGNWTVSASGSIITIRYDDNKIYEKTIDANTPKQNGYVIGKITVYDAANGDAQYAKYDFDQ